MILIWLFFVCIFIPIDWHSYINLLSFFGILKWQNALLFVKFIEFFLFSICLDYMCHFEYVLWLMSVFEYCGVNQTYWRLKIIFNNIKLYEKKINEELRFGAFLKMQMTFNFFFFSISFFAVSLVRCIGWFKFLMVWKV